MATRSSIFAWEIPRTEETGGLYSPRGHKRVGHDLVTRQQYHHKMHYFTNSPVSYYLLVYGQKLSYLL